MISSQLLANNGKGVSKVSQSLKSSKKKSNALDPSFHNDIDFNFIEPNGFIFLNNTLDKKLVEQNNFPGISIKNNSYLVEFEASQSFQSNKKIKWK